MLPATFAPSACQPLRAAGFARRRRPLLGGALRTVGVLLLGLARSRRRLLGSRPLRGGLLRSRLLGRLLLVGSLGLRLVGLLAAARRLRRLRTTLGSARLGSA